MFISNIKIKDFRNIVKADVDFNKINIITGKNSSGKSNFLLALANSISTNYDYKDVFDNNIVTFAPGKKQTRITTTIKPESEGSLYFEKDRYVYINIDNYVFDKLISKKTSQSLAHKLFFTGNVATESRKNMDQEKNIFKSLAKMSKQAKKQSHQLVEDIAFDFKLKSGSLEKIITEDSIEKYVEYSLSNDEHKEKHYNYIKNYSRTIYPWISDSKFSSNLIYDYVIRREENETYIKALENLKIKNKKNVYGMSQINFKDSKFIFLLSDIQKNQVAMENYKNDLSLYTQDIVKKVYINTVGADGTRGEILVDSPYGPKDIYSISTGTAVLLFFITLKHWLQLKASDTYYKKPQVMIFDEIDSIIHPSLMPEFNEVLRSISKKMQLFISTHSPKFIDYYKLEEIYLIKDSLHNTKNIKNRSNIYSYKQIIDKLSEDDKQLLKKKPSELFVDGLIEAIL